MRRLKDYNKNHNIQRELDKSEHDLYNKTPVMMHSMSNKGVLLSVSNFRDEVIGRENPVEFLTKESQAYAKFVLADFMKTGGCKNISYQMIKKNGDIIDVLLSASAEFDDNNNLLRSVAVITDVTNLKNAEKKLNITIEELTKSNIALERFAHIASHDLREPLRNISSCTQLLEMKLDDHLDNPGKQIVNMIITGVDRMADLVDSLLSYSRLNANPTKLELIDSNVTLKLVLENLKHSIKNNDVTLKYDDLPKIYADKTQFSQLLQNLISNSIKYRSEKKIKINIKARVQGAYWGLL